MLSCTLIVRFLFGLSADTTQVFKMEPGKWSHWEMHPEGDEVVQLLKGSVDIVMELPEDTTEGGGTTATTATNTIELRGGGAAVIPQGLWHTAHVHAPSEAIFITRGAGTQHRPAA